MEKRILIQPGDIIEIKNKENHEIVIGPGLRKDRKDIIVAMKCGALRQKDNNFFWIDSHQKRVILLFYIFYFWLF
jgi:hypothetical protein